MVLGEPQILGQIKDAVQTAQEQNTVGAWLNSLFQKTFSVAKEIRSGTSVGEHSVSMAAASVKMAEQIFPSVGKLNVLFVGAGEMIELVATYFAAENPRLMTVANRTLERAEELCGKLGITPNLPAERHSRHPAPIRCRDFLDCQPAAHHRQRHGRTRT